MRKAGLRVEADTCPLVNRRIRDDMRRRVVCLAEAGAGPMDRRIGELDSEWDIEQILELHVSVMTLAGVLAAVLSRRRMWLIVPAGIALSLMYHVFRGTCPPERLLRRTGVRTRREIERERYVLKALRGDFKSVPERRASPGERSDGALRAVEA